MYVPITLKLKRPNFTRWSAFFCSLCGKLGLPLPIDGMTVMYPNDPTWAMADSCIHNYLLYSITDDILGLTLEPDQTSC
jgi:hypothetical protein